MRLTYPQVLCRLTLLAFLSALPTAAQDLRVDVFRRATGIPKSCISLAPASMEEPLNLAALTKEAICKGDGDMLINYTYVMNMLLRGKDKKGRVNEESTTYEVFIPTLKSGMATRGILLVTNRNGFAVPRAELEKERLRTGQRLEKEEERLKNAGAPAPRKAGAQIMTGLVPVGMYTSMSINSPTHGFQKGGATLAVNDFLRTSNLTFLRRAEREGRESLVFRFDPRPDVAFDIGEKYMARLTGEIWIDVTDRIVTRLVGWPNISDPANTLTKPKAGAARPGVGERPPAVSVEMVRSRAGTWLPRELRLNGMDYPTLFDRITYDSTWTYSNYIHFFTDVRDFTADVPKSP